MQRGMPDAALKDYNEAVRLAPNVVGGYLGRAGYHSSRKDYEKALVDLNEVLKLDPESPWCHELLGNLWLDRGDADKALVEFNEMIRLGPNSASAAAPELPSSRHDGTLTGRSSIWMRRFVSIRRMTMCSPCGAKCG